jgi:hypothetical protein
MEYEGMKNTVNYMYRFIAFRLENRNENGLIFTSKAAF